MRHRSRALALALGAAGAGVAGAGVAGAASPPAPAELTVEVTNLRNAKGLVRACLTSEAEGFPDCSDPARSYQIAVPAMGRVTLTFLGVRPGRYAVALLHDENGNGKADRAAMMIPREGFGFSRDAKVRFGPPRFAAAAFDIASGSAERISIRMRYML